MGRCPNIRPDSSNTRNPDKLVVTQIRAWRRSLTADERKAVLASYHAERKDGVKHDPAFRAALARVLSSPWFLYRVEQPASRSKASAGRVSVQVGDTAVLHEMCEL
ncbi:MAG: DUF1595 domain-containing protein [Planctomycetaceae bacterium]|nr:DUF1595 domain-containing protein [Planctomycetaceae bacterium]